jgi:hypothetical protein
VNVSFPTTGGTYTDANWGPQDASHPTTEDATVTIAEVQSLLGHIVFRMGGPVCWGCTQEKGTVSRSSCKSEIYATNEETKSALTVCNLLYDFGFPDGIDPSPVWNDNRGCVDWTKGVSVSKKLRHINMRELGVRLAQQSGHVDIQHIDGKKNIADLFTKEIKDSKHFQAMAFTITTPRLIVHIDISRHDSLAVIKAGVKQTDPTTNSTASSWTSPLVCKALKEARRLPTALLGTRVLT